MVKMKRFGSELTDAAGNDRDRLIAVIQDNDIGIISCTELSFAVIEAEHGGRIDRTAVQSDIKGNQSPFDQIAQSFVDLQGAAGKVLFFHQMR